MTSLFMTSFRIYNLNSPQFQDFPINWDHFLEKASYKSKTLYKCQRMIKSEYRSFPVKLSLCINWDESFI